MEQRCANCRDIPITEFKSPADYMAALQSFDNMVKAGRLGITYQSMDIPTMLAGGINLMPRFFHQFICPDCGAVYGMLCNMKTGGQIKINEKVFDPSEYPDRKEEK
ncbi:MAG: hypothetical protein IJ561_04035 [Ruminococcus sp.]|nr:hypothetical protein [Ruminococcus sp.]